MMSHCLADMLIERTVSVMHQLSRYIVLVCYCAMFAHHLPDRCKHLDYVHVQHVLDALLRIAKCVIWSKIGLHFMIFNVI